MTRPDIEATLHAREPVDIVAVTVDHLAEAVVVLGFLILATMWIAIGAV